MSTNVTIIGLGDCLKGLANTERLDKAHPINVRTEGAPNKYTTYFIVPKKAKHGKDRFEITVNAVLAEGRDAAEGAVLAQENPGDTFLVTTFAGVLHHDVVRALRAFVAANNMSTAEDEEPAAEERLPGIIGRTWESAGKRPLPGANVNDVLDVLETTLNRISANVLKRAMVTPFDVKDVLDELRWVANRWDVFEHGLIRLAQGKTTPELDTVLETRASVLYWLFDRDNNGPSNEEIIALCKQSNNPKFTDEISFHIPPGYKGGNPVKLMGEALRAVEVYERNFGPFVAEPDHMLVIRRAGADRRFINPAWIEWWGNYSDRPFNPLNEVENRVRESYKDRKDLKNLGVRIEEVAAPDLFQDDALRLEILISYQAFL